MCLCIYKSALCLCACACAGAVGKKSKKQKTCDSSPTPSEALEDVEDDEGKEIERSTHTIEFTAHLLMLGGTHPHTGRTWQMV